MQNYVLRVLRARLSAMLEWRGLPLLQRPCVAAPLVLAAWLLLMLHFKSHYEFTIVPSWAQISKGFLKIRKPGVLYVEDVYVSGYQHPHPELCPARGTNLRIMILVTSKPSHFVTRHMIRLTWGSVPLPAGVGFAFVLGEPPDRLRRGIEDEIVLHGDIIMGRYIDSYSNLTLKTLSMLEWMHTYCPYAPYLLKTDDDMFVDIARLLNFTAALDRINPTRTIWGKVWAKAVPARHPSSKYYVSWKEFPEEVYPNYADGTGYCMSTDCVQVLLEEALSQPFMRMEDVFVTGIVASRLGIQRVNVADTFANIIWNNQK